MDPRLTPANQNVACSSLRGQIEHANFVECQNYQVNVPFVDLLGAPGGERNRQLIYGSKVKYFGETDGWAFIQNAYDNYVGYVPRETINLDTNKTHIVSAPLSHVFSEPNIKAKNIATLPLAAKVSGKAVAKIHIDGPLGVRGRNSNNDLIREKLGWDYSQTLEEGISKTYAWIEGQINK